MANGFGSLTWLLPATPALVGHQANPGDPPPWLHPRYQASSLLRGGRPLCPASVRSPLQVCCLGISLSRLTARPTSRRVEATGSHVPHKSLSRARATFMPDTTWPVGRLPPGSSRSNFSTPVSMSSRLFRHVISGSLPLAFASRTGRAPGAPFPQRSPPRLLTG